MSSNAHEITLSRARTFSLSHDPGVLATPVKEFDRLDMATAITRKLPPPLCRLWRQRGGGSLPRGGATSF